MGTGAQGAKDIGQLTETSIVSSDGTYRETHGYDGYGRPSRRTIQIPDEPAYVYDFEYSPTTGALDTLRFPDTLGTRFALKYGYDSVSGVLNEVRDANTGTVYWRLDALNPFGQTIEQFGNSVVRKRTFDPVTGWLEKLEAGPGNEPTRLQNASVLYDEVGNVQQRTNNLGSLPAALVEDFTNRNDPLYRFKSGTVTADGAPVATLTIDEYDSLGNIKIKRDTSGLDSPLDYTVTWTGYNYPSSIESPTMREKVSFAYGPDRQRWRMVYEDLASGRTETTFYAGLMEKVVINDGGSQRTEYRYYIPGGAEPIAIHTRTSGTSDTRYLLTDHLGSLDTVLDEAGNRLASQSYSPYGLPRDPSAWTGAPASSSDAYTRQGYTFQTVLGRLGMNHMNGRVQDALTGQFLSPDPFVTEPGNTQNWNRYAYVYNNPLTFIDPSGFQTVPPDGAPPGLPFPGGEPIDERCITPTGNVFSEPVCNYLTRQWGLGSTIAQGVTAKVRAEYERELVGSTGAGVPGISLADGSLCAQAGLAPICFTADVRPYGYPFSIYSADADLLYEGIEEYADAYEHRFDIVKDLTIGWLMPYESEGDVQLAGVGSAGSRAARALALRSIRIGQRGESLVRRIHNIGPKTPISIGGRDRIPDGLTKAVLSEVKNVRYLHYSQQLQDFAAFARANHLRFDLYVRRSTVLSDPLDAARRAGHINIRFIP